MKRLTELICARAPVYVRVRASECVCMGEGLNFWNLKVRETWLRQWPCKYTLYTAAGRWKQFANNSDELDSSRQYLIECVVFMSNRVCDFATFWKPQKLKHAPDRKYIHIIYCITSTAFVSQNTGKSIKQCRTRLPRSVYHILGTYMLPRKPRRCRLTWETTYYIL